MVVRSFWHIYYMYQKLVLLCWFSFCNIRMMTYKYVELNKIFDSWLFRSVNFVLVYVLNMISPKMMLTLCFGYASCITFWTCKCRYLICVSLVVRKSKACIYFHMKSRQSLINGLFLFLQPTKISVQHLWILHEGLTKRARLEITVECTNKTKYYENHVGIWNTLCICFGLIEK